jgi:hypothetical protein
MIHYFRILWTTTDQFRWEVTGLLINIMFIPCTLLNSQTSKSSNQEVQKKEAWGRKGQTSPYVKKNIVKWKTIKAGRNKRLQHNKITTFLHRAFFHNNIWNKIICQSTNLMKFLTCFKAGNLFHNSRVDIFFYNNFL